MKNNKKVVTNYSFLWFLPLTLVLTLEYFQKEIIDLGVPLMTLTLLTAMLYVTTGALSMAFVSSTKLTSEKKYIMYLMILSVVVIKSLSYIKMLVS